MLAFDTEDNQRGFVWMINFFDGEKHYFFEGLNCRLEAWNFLEEYGKTDLWATNAEYDLVNLFGEYVGQMCTLQYVSAGFLRARTCFGQRVLDTMRHWPASVKDMGDMIGLPKLDHGGDFLNKTYCQRDTEIVWRYVNEMLKRYDGLGLSLRSTLPSMALQYWQKMEGKTKYELSDREKQWLRNGYYGGRVECYKLGQVQGTINNYDFNSLFPSCMEHHDFPLIQDLAWSDHLDLTQYGMADVTVNVPYQQFPPLPYHGLDELMYPYGRLTGIWTYPELRYAIESCGVTLEKVHQCFQGRGKVRPFDTYVRTCYKKRLASDNTVDKTFWKLFLNSLYGKFAQWGGIECIHKDREITLAGSASHVNVVWSAYVTSYARIKLHQSLRACSQVYYTDTDSLFTPDDLPTGPNIGELKLESQSDGMLIRGNKIYVFNKKSKAKGVPKAQAAEFITTGRAVYRKPVRYRLSRRSLLRPNYWTEFEKTLNSSYTKRRVCANGYTDPWNLSDYYSYIS